MGKIGEGRGNPFWRAGQKPVRPVRAVRKTEENERGTTEVKKTATKEKGEKALSREDKRQYHDAVTEERRVEEDGERRESRGII